MKDNEIALLIYAISAVVTFIGGIIYHTVIEKRNLTLGNGISNLAVSLIPAVNTVFSVYLIGVILKQFIVSYELINWDRVIIKAKKNTREGYDG